MANGDENNRRTDKTDLDIARERLDVQREMAGLKKGATTDDKFSLSLANKLINIAQNHLDIENQRLDLTRESKDVAKDLLKAETNRKRILQQIKKDGGDNSKILKENLDLSEQIVAELKKEEKSVKKIEASFGLTGASLGVINKLLGGQIPNLKNISEETRNRLGKLERENKLLDGTLGKFQAFGIQVSEIGKAIGKNMLDPLVLIKIGLDYSKELADLQKGFGISRKEALGLRIEAGAIASETGNIAIQSKDVLKTIHELNKSFGTTSTVLRDDIVSEMTKLGKLTNMSAESQANFARFANMSGKNAATITKETRRAVVNAEQEKGLRVDINGTLDEAGKINGQIAAQLGGNVTKIAQAVTVAKQFGMTLEGVAAAGAQLLNFESSISNELEAELLIGKELNLEKARLAALTGDYETLTREINANIGDFGDFTKMNVLQQEALAKSVGMTADGLSDVLLKNENIEALAQEARLAGDEDLAKQLEARSAQEKFNDTVEKLKGIFSDLVGGPLSAIIDVFAGVLETIGGVTKALGLGSGGINDLIVKGLIFAKILGGSVGHVMKMFTLMKGIKLSQIGINTAESLGLITKRQGVMIKTREQMLNKTAIVDSAAKNFYENATLGATIKRNAAKKTSNVLSGIGLAIEKLKLGSMLAQGVAIIKNIAKEGILLAVKVATAAATLVGVSVATLGIGTAVGLAAAAAGIAYLSSQTSKVGDLGIDPNGGPIVMSPSEGGIFQGTNNDGLSMGPGFGTKGGSGGGSVASVNMNETNNIMKEQNKLLAGILSKPNFESIWAQSGENLGSRASGELKYGNVGTGLS
jgi:hypothetical protein